MTKTQEIPAEIMQEAREIALAARKLVRNTIDAIAVEEMLRDRILAGLLAERLHGDTAARKECVEIARNIDPNAHDIATAIEATITGGGDEQADLVVSCGTSTRIGDLAAKDQATCVKDAG